MNPQFERAAAIDAWTNLNYGHRAGIACLAAIVNDLSFKVGLAATPKNEKDEPVVQFDESVASFFQMDGIEKPKPVSLDDLTMGFAAAQFLLIDLMNKPDPESYGQTHASWAHKYLRDAGAIAKNIIDWKIRAGVKDLEAKAAAMREAGIDCDVQQAINKLRTSVDIDDNVKTRIDEALRRAVTVLRGSDTETLQKVVLDTYAALNVSLTARIYQSVCAILGAQAKRLSTNAGFVSIDNGLVALKKALDPPKPLTA